MFLIAPAAKQDAFEESIRLKNQFRNLDEDEVEFLDSVLESTRKKEDEVKKQTSEQLDLFRRQQEEADKAALEGAGEETRGEGIGSKEGGQEETWAVNKGKRKRTEKKKGLKGFKLRKASSSAHDDGEKVDGGRAGSSSHTTGLPSTTPTTKSQPNITAASNSIASVSTSPVENPEVSQAAAKTTQAAPSGLELGGYSSDEDD